MTINIKTFAETAKQYASADKKYESAAAARDRIVAKFADLLKEQGLTTGASFRPKGEFGTEFKDAVASQFLTKTEFKAYASDKAAFTTVNGKRVYSAKHNAGVKVANFIKRLLDAVERHITAEAKPADAKDAKDATKRASRNKPLAEAIEFALKSLSTRIGNDKRKSEPTGKEHDALKEIIAQARKDCAKLLK